jgi:hypothetical protein
MIDSQILHTTEVKLTGLLLPGLDFLPFLKIRETIAFFHSAGTLPSSIDLLKKQV